MKLTPYLTSDGNGMEMAKHYADILGGEIVSSVTFGEMPDQDWVTEDMKGRLAHAMLAFGENRIMLSDTAGQEPFNGYAGHTMQLSVESVEEGQALFDKLAQGGEVRMPYGKTFWAEAFGMCNDKFGVGWMVNCDG